MPAGTVKFFDATRGFGFIAPDDGREDIFVHIRDVEKAGLAGLAVGDFLEFDVILDKRSGKFRAAELELVDTADDARAPRSP